MHAVASPYCTLRFCAAWLSWLFCIQHCCFVPYFCTFTLYILPLDVADHRMVSKLAACSGCSRTNDVVRIA